MKFFTSLKLTVWCLAVAVLLVFIGTMAQVDQGLYQAQARYFKSFFIYWSPGNSGLKIPVFPGGYLLGSLMLINLVAAHAVRFKFLWKKAGVIMIHGGMILLLVGQLLTDVLSKESAMRLEVGETKNYSEDFHANELTLIDVTDPASDRVIAVPESLLKKQSELRLPDLPFIVRVQKYWPNTDVVTGPTNGAVASEATQGFGVGQYIIPYQPTTKMDERNLPSAVIELVHGQKSLGSWLVSSRFRSQTFTNDNRVYNLALRFKRHYNNYTITLLDCAHDVYKGTDIPKNFSSEIRLDNPSTGESRPAKIFMNNPLRYAGTTYYQFQMDTISAAKASTLQVVTNPSWLTPYFSCVLVGLGMTFHFMSTLLGFLRKRKVA